MYIKPTQFHYNTQHNSQLCRDGIAKHKVTVTWPSVFVECMCCNWKVCACFTDQGWHLIVHWSVLVAFSTVTLGMNIIAWRWTVRRSRLIVLTSVKSQSLPLHQLICQHVSTTMITHWRLARALDGMCAPVGSETEGGLTPCGEVMLVAKLSIYLFFFHTQTHTHMHKQASVYTACMFPSSYS